MRGGGESCGGEVVRSTRRTTIRETLDESIRQDAQVQVPSTVVGCVCRGGCATLQNRLVLMLITLHLVGAAAWGNHTISHMDA
jgi:hypothetical protein